MVAQFIQSDEGQLRAGKDAIFKVLLQRWGVPTGQKYLQIAVALTECADQALYFM